MHSKLLSILILALLGASQAAHAAPWTYRGSLNDGGKPANGSYDLRLTLTDAAGVHAIGQPLTLYGVAVKEGNFAADVDFGVDLSNAPTLKLKTEVAQGGSGFVSLGEPTRFDPKAALAGVCWDTTGNVVAAGEFLGSTNNVAVDIRANNLRIGRFQAAGTPADYGDAPNVVLGSPANTVTGRGATVAGGGATRLSGVDFSTGRNAAANDFASVAGGFGNVSGGAFASVGGGFSNGAAGDSSAVSGGRTNAATGLGATVAGGINNSAYGDAASIPGGSGNCAGGDTSWAGGRSATVRHPNDLVGVIACGTTSGDANGDEGTFVWADAVGGEFSSTGPNQFLVRAAGGMAINTPIPTAGASLTVSGGTSLFGNTTTSGSISFGLATRQMMNLYDTTYGIGVQTARMYFRVAPTGGYNWFMGGTHSSLVDDAGGGSTLMRLTSAGQLFTTTGTISTFSDARLKSDVSDYSGALDQIAALRPVHYRYTNAGKAPFQPEGTHLGFIAQEVQQVFPEWVSEDDSGYLMLSMRGFEAVAVRGMQELQAENAALRAQANAQALETAALRARLEAIEAKLGTPSERASGS